MADILIAPSLLSADFAAAGEAVRLVETAGADWVHLDVMDGVFVPALTFGPKMVADVRGASALPFDVHLMTTHPADYCRPFADAGADAITFHLEAAVHAHRNIADIHALGKKAGVSIVPSTPVAALDELLDEADIVLVMTVDPGAGGQALIPSCLKKVQTLAQTRQQRGLHFLISVDGGVNANTATAVREAGADVLVAGSAFFNATDKTALVRTLRGKAQ
jgi:ribulose-phosphate 3-epimerase